MMLAELPRQYDVDTLVTDIFVRSADLKQASKAAADEAEKKKKDSKKKKSEIRQLLLHIIWMGVAYPTGDATPERSGPPYDWTSATVPQARRARDPPSARAGRARAMMTTAAARRSRGLPTRRTTSPPPRFQSPRLQPWTVLGVRAPALSASRGSRIRSLPTLPASLFSSAAANKLLKKSGKV